MTIETKFNIGDTVFFLSDNKIEEGIVKRIQIDAYETGDLEIYSVRISTQTTMQMSSHYLFPSKQELLASL